MAAPRVSIVIVNWKTPRLLARSLDTIKADRGSDSFEIWVVDNHSEDETLELLASRYPAVRVIANTDNLGFSRGCNQAIPQASGKYILLLNPDTEVVDSATSTLADYMDSHPDCGAAGPKVLNPDGSLQLACRRAFPSLAASFYRITYLSRLFPDNPTFSKYNFTSQDPDKELEVDALSGSCMMVPKKVIDQV
ncbi:MAG TPA: glycosyltransferase family 2 protein, partial [Chroococcales cyanobacterium]